MLANLGKIFGIVLLLLTISLGALGQGEFGDKENIDEELYYDLDDIKDLDISVSTTRIRIRVVNSDKLRVHLHGSSKGQKPFLDDKESGSSLTIEVKRKPGLGFSRSNLELDIDIPKGYDQTNRSYVRVLRGVDKLKNGLQHGIFEDPETFTEKVFATYDNNTCSMYSMQIVRTFLPF